MDFILGILVGGAAVWVLKTFLAPTVEKAIDQAKEVVAEKAAEVKTAVVEKVEEVTK